MRNVIVSISRVLSLVVFLIFWLSVLIELFVRKNLSCCSVS